jgi:hypothetical protein
MIAYKLFQQKQKGISSLFIDAKKILPTNKWLPAKKLKRKGFKFRPYWHAVQKPHAPHLSKKKRVWYKVEVKDFIEFKRPKNHGSKWLLAKQIRILHPI